MARVKANFTSFQHNRGQYAVDVLTLVARLCKGRENIGLVNMEKLICVLQMLLF